jgi:hypothetical protein
MSIPEVDREDLEPRPAEALTSNDLLLVIGILDEVDQDLSAGYIGAARTRVRGLQSTVLKHADLLRERERYRARQASEDAARTAVTWETCSWWIDRS